MKKMDGKEVVASVIPKVEEMLQKETAHLAMLKEYRDKTQLLGDFRGMEMVDEMVERSERMKEHLETRLDEYRAYCAEKE